MSQDLREWTPQDYLVKDSYCPTSLVDSAVEELRVRTGSRMALLLVADERAMLRSLAVCAGSEPISSEISSWLRSSDFADELRRPADNKPRIVKRQLQDLLRFVDPLLHQEPPAPGRRGPSPESDKRFPLSIRRILRRLSHGATSQDHPEMAEIFDSADWYAVDTDGLDASRVRVALLCLEPRPNLLRSDKRLGLRVSSNAEVERIFERLVGTAQINVRRDHLTISSLEDLLEGVSALSGSEELGDAIKALVTFIVEVTKSEAGACYRWKGVNPRLEKIAEPLAETGWSYPPELPPGVVSVAAHATETGHRVLHIPDSDSEFEPTPESPTNDIFELAVPIREAVGSATAPSLGVLSIARSAKGSFGAYELSLVRNASLRLAAMFHMDTTSAITKMIGNASSANPPVPSMEDRQRHEPPLPDDLLMAQPKIDAILEAIGTATLSQSATFRSALPMSDTVNPLGVSLRRVSAFPLETNDRYLDHRHREKGVNWEVALSGTQLMIDPQDPMWTERFKAHRTGSRAELCLPVRVQGRLEGVLNLESRRKNAYHDHIDSAQAAAALIGLAIADARLSLASSVQEYGQEIARRVHTTKHDRNRLATPESLNESEEVEKFMTAVEELRDDVEHLLDAVPPMYARDTKLTDKMAFGRSTLAEITEAICDRMSFRVSHYGDPEYVPQPLSEPTGRALANALPDLLDNVRRHRVTGLNEHEPLEEWVLDDPHFEYTTFMWAGQPHSVLRFKMLAAKSLVEVEAANLYRCPSPTLSEWIELSQARGAPTKSHPKLGAYLVHLHLARVGGMVNFAAHRRHIEVSVTVPAPNQSKE